MKIIVLLLIACMLAAGCVTIPTGQDKPLYGPGNFSSNDSILVGVVFPDSVNRTDNWSSQGRSFLASVCPHAYECLSQIANISCSWYDAVGALACPGVTKTCFVTAVDSVDPTGGNPLSGNYWSLQVNGNSSTIGISCYVPKAGDELELVVTNASLT